MLYKLLAQVLYFKIKIYLMIVKNENTKQTQQEPYKFEERPQIDGLRAISVALVVIYHLRIWLFEHGFVGVQVFFVISGYLITAVILRDLTRNRFNLRGFYERRLKRIFPNLLFCCLTNFVIVVCFNLYEARQASQSGLLSLLMLKNIQGQFKTTLFYQGHFWTLAVQWHFYLIWPLLVPILVRQTFKKQITILVIFTIISYISLVFILYLRVSSLACGWNLMLGAMITFDQYEKQKNQKNQKKIQAADSPQMNESNPNKIQTPLNMINKDQQSSCNGRKVGSNILSITALGIIITLAQLGFGWLPSVQIDVMEYQWIINGIAGLSAFVLIYNRGTYLQLVLSNKVLRFIGRQSYWIYVWHYPYIMIIEKIGVTWLRVLYLLFALIGGIFQDRIANVRHKSAAYWILGIYLFIIATFVTALLAVQ